MQLSIKGLGLAMGIFWGVILFIWTVVNVYYSYGAGSLDLMAEIYPFYSVTWPGAFVGLVVGFLDGFVGGAILAWLYNKLA